MDHYLGRRDGLFVRKTVDFICVLVMSGFVVVLVIDDHIRYEEELLAQVVTVCNGD